MTRHEALTRMFQAYYSTPPEGRVRLYAERAEIFPEVMVARAAVRCAEGRPRCPSLAEFLVVCRDVRQEMLPREQQRDESPVDMILRGELPWSKGLRVSEIHPGPVEAMRAAAYSESSIAECLLGRAPWPSDEEIARTKAWVDEACSSPQRRRAMLTLIRGERDPKPAGHASDLTPLADEIPF